MLPRKIRRYEKLEHGLQANSYFGKEGGVAVVSFPKIICFQTHISSIIIRVYPIRRSLNYTQVIISGVIEARRAEGGKRFNSYKLFCPFLQAL